MYDVVSATSTICHLFGLCTAMTGNNTGFDMIQGAAARNGFELTLEYIQNQDLGIIRKIEILSESLIKTP